MRVAQDRKTRLSKKVAQSASYAKNFTSYDDCLTAVEANGYAIGYIPKEFRILPEIQMAAVKQDGWAIKFLIQDNIKFSEEVAIQAVQNSYSAYFFIKDDNLKKKVRPWVQF